MTSEPFLRMVATALLDKADEKVGGRQGLCAYGGKVGVEGDIQAGFNHCEGGDGLGSAQEAVDVVGRGIGVSHVERLGVRPPVGKRLPKPFLVAGIDPDECR